MLNLGCGQYLRNPFFPGFWGQKWGCGFCILADYARLYTSCDVIAYHLVHFISIWVINKCQSGIDFFTSERSI